jgi:hypothetical protein
MSQPAIVDRDARDRVGLCADCVHLRLIASPRGSTFYFCELSKSDPLFPKYPRLPVRACAGYQPRPKDA